MRLPVARQLAPLEARVRIRPRQLHRVVGGVAEVAEAVARRADELAQGVGAPRDDGVRAELLAEIATDIVTMLHSSRAAVRAAVLRRSDG